MPARKSQRPILVPDAPSIEGYTPHPPGRLPPPLLAPRGGGPAHGAALQAELLKAQREERARRAEAEFEMPLGVEADIWTPVGSRLVSMSQLPSMSVG